MEAKAKNLNINSKKFYPVFVIIGGEIERKLELVAKCYSDLNAMISTYNLYDDEPELSEKIYYRKKFIEKIEQEIKVLRNLIK